MGVRSQIQFDIQIGAENSLDSLLFSRAIQELLDTMDNQVSQSGTLSPSEVKVIDKGDITNIRFAYVEGDGDLSAFFDGIAATTAVVTGVGGAYPTGFAGGETLDLEIDGVAFTTTFDDADEPLSAVFARINSAAGLAGIPGLVASDSGGELRLTSNLEGVASEVKVVAASAGVAAILGLAVPTTVNGVDPTPAMSPFTLKQMGDTSNPSAVDTLKAYLLVTINSTGLTLTNPSSTDAVRYRLLLLGDLVDPADADC